MWRYVAIGLLVIGTISTWYFGWAFHRVTDSVLVSDLSWPRSAPYPDRWLLALNNWYDARHPVEPGSIKIHGELDRVRLTVLACIGASLMLVVSGLFILHEALSRGRGQCAERAVPP